jgi:hypothetical protein
MMRLAAIAVLVGLSACSASWDDKDKGPGVAATGSGTSRSFAVEDFTGVALKGSDDVDIRVGAGFSVRAEGPRDELDRLRITRDGDTLDIGRKNGMSWGSHDAVKMFVTLPRLASATVAGSGDMQIDRVEGAGFDGNIAGSGNMAIGAVSLDKMTMSIAGSGTMTAAGNAETVGVDLAGSGNVRSAGLHARKAAVKVAGSGDVKLAVDGMATVRIMGSGDVDLGPAAKCNVKTTGSGTVRCG